MAFTIQFLCFLLLIYITLKIARQRKLPPGPFAWPLIGTLLPNFDAQRSHLELSNLAKIHGPLMLLKFGVEYVVVASTHVAAREVLKTHDRELSGRFAPHSTRIPGYIEHSMVWSDCTDYWKFSRKVWRTELLSPKMLDLQSAVRERKVAELITFLRRREGSEVMLAEVICGAILNMLGALLYSKDVYDYEDGSDNNTGIKGIIRQLLILAASPNNLADLFPILGWWDFQGLRKETAECVKRMNDSWAGIVKERRNSTGLHGDDKDFLQVLIDSEFTDPQIDAMLLEAFGPGSDTSTCTLEWAMAELLHHPDKLTKLRQELDEVVGKNPAGVQESHLSNLPYLHACMKETLRLHPPVTFLLPHRATETCQVMGYTIPKGFQLMVNTYAIGRDPSTWDAPLEFRPERFIGSEVDYRGNDFEYIPLGAGRRICPGLTLATRVVRLILASLIHSFEWRLPAGMQPEDMDMKDKFAGALLKDVPLVVVPQSRFV